MAVAARESPESPAEAAAILREAAARDRPVRLTGGRTKLAWGYATRGASIELSSSALERIVEHNVGDFTAVLQAGVRLVDAQAAFAASGQMLAVDPPLGDGSAATIGGVLATGDSGPLRHRYGAPRDLVLGMTIALPDGTVAQSGGRVIKNVAGYDLAKLFTASFGTLGAIVEAVVRLHPRSQATTTLVARSDDPGALARAALELARAPLELEALDVEWRDGRGAILARFAGSTARERAERVRLDALRSLPLELDAEDAELWEGQRRGQRSAEGTVVRVSGLPFQLERVLGTADRLSAFVVGRAALGLSWLTLPATPPAETAAALEDLRRELAPSPCVVLDAPPDVRERVDVWGPIDAPLFELTRRLRKRFDPGGVCNRGVHVG